MHVTDLWLVYRVCQGRRSEFDKLYQRHAQRVYNLLRRLCSDTTLAEDLTQETFVAAFESLSQWKRKGAFSSWLCGIAVNRYRLRCRSTAVESGDEPLTNDLPASAESDPVARYSGLEALRALESAIAALPMECREAFVLVYVEEFAYKEAAEALSVPVGTVQSRLNRAKRLLYKQLSPAGKDAASVVSGSSLVKGDTLNVL